MTTIPQLQPLVQTLFTSRANEIAIQTGFIRRQRKLTGAQFLQATVFGWLQHPSATRQQLHQSLLLTGQTISAQGFEQRFSSSAVAFLRAMAEEATSQVFEATVLSPILEQFKGVYLTDSTRLEETAYPLKIAARLELQRGSLQLSLEDLDTHDNVIGVCDGILPTGALHIGDLGFFDLERFRDWAETGVEWISRYKRGTHLYTPDGDGFDLVSRLSGRSKSLSQRVHVGQKHRLPMYLRAQRVSESVYQQRLKRLRRTASRKQCPLTPVQQLFARWTLYLTSVADLTFDQLHILYRARWQIECLFKRWKSLGQLDHSLSADPQRRACELLAKFLAVLLAHWMTQAHVWPHSQLSPAVFFRALQSLTPVLYLAFFHSPALLSLLDALLTQILPASRLSHRKKAP